jgi:hypothetical protein
MSRRACTNKDVGIQFLISLYNLCNVIVYYHTVNDFPQDMKFSDNKIIENLEDLGSWDGVLLLLTSAILLVSNQRAYTANLKQALQQSVETAGPTGSNRCMRNLAVIDSIASSGYKSVALVLAATAFLKETFSIDSDLGKYVALGFVSLFTIGGSFTSELSIYLKPYVRTNTLSCVRGRTQNPAVWGHLLTFMFMLCDTILYFNNFDKFRLNLGWSDHRLSKLRDSWDIPFFVYTVISSVGFIIATQTTFSRTVRDLLMSRSQLLVLSSKDDAGWQKTVKSSAAYSSIIYKTASITLGFMAVVFLLSDGSDWQWPVTGASGILSFIGNLAAQYSIYAPPGKNAARLFYDDTVSRMSPTSSQDGEQRDDDYAGLDIAAIPPAVGDEAVNPEAYTPLS